MKSLQNMKIYSAKIYWFTVLSQKSRKNEFLIFQSIFGVVFECVMIIFRSFEGFLSFGKTLFTRGFTACGLPTTLA